MTVEHGLKTVVAVGCAYEITALLSGAKLPPTISTLCKRYRWVEVGLIAILITHLHWEEQLMERLNAARYSKQGRFGRVC